MALRDGRADLFSALFGEGEGSSKDGKGGSFERPQQFPPYFVPAGKHAVDKRIEIEDGGLQVLAKAAGLTPGQALAKFGFGGVIDESSDFDGPHTNALPSADDVHTLFTMAGALFPPYDPEVLSSLMEHSNSLRPNVDAYKTNIDGFGYNLDPVIAIEDPKAAEKVGDAMYLDRLRDAELRGEVLAPYPTDEEIGKKTEEIRSLMRLERAQIEQFFEHCAGELSFKELRRRTREDLEVTGNGYWEVLRNAAGKIAEFYLVPSYSMRLAPIEHVLHPVRVKRKLSPFRYDNVVVRRRFRRLIQIVLDRIVYFKEFGDSRVISKRTGRVYANEEELRRDAVHDGPATEVIHFKIYSPRSPYGVPRWIGNLLAVLGSRASEEVNYLYFDNKAVPPLALLVSGGKLAQGATEKIQSYIGDNIRGKENFHKILVIEAEQAAGGPKQLAETGRVRLDLVPLRDAQQDDALFQGYDQANQDKVGQSFRVPRILRGDTKDFNRATADAALQYAETQVFQGEREVFDDLINRTIFAELGVRFWTFKSNSPVNRDPLDASKILTAVLPVLTANEARDVAGDMLNRVLPQIDAAWGQQPMPMTLAGSVAEEGGAGAAPPGQKADGVDEDGEADSSDGPPAGAPPPGNSKQQDRDLLRLTARIMGLRDSIRKRAEATQAKELVKATREEGEVVLEVPRETFRSWFLPNGDASSPH
jgi:PBSX family phage portal protein